MTGYCFRFHREVRHCLHEGHGFTTALETASRLWDMGGSGALEICTGGAGAGWDGSIHGEKTTESAGNVGSLCLGVC